MPSISLILPIFSISLLELYALDFLPAFLSIALLFFNELIILSIIALRSLALSLTYLSLYFSLFSLNTPVLTISSILLDFFILKKLLDNFISSLPILAGNETSIIYPFLLLNLNVIGMIPLFSVFIPSLANNF